jgi:hypothetical protein
MTTSLVRPFAVISGAQVHRALDRREKQIVELAEATYRLMVALGSRVHVIAEPDPVDGFLGARLDYVRALCASDDRYVRLNQYNNPGDRRRTTARRTGDRAPVPAAGCALRRRRHRRDPDGRRALLPGVASGGAGHRHGQRRLGGFRGAPGRRMIPGLGTSVPAPLLPVQLGGGPPWPDVLDSADLSTAHRPG